MDDVKHFIIWLTEKFIPWEALTRKKSKIISKSIIPQFLLYVHTAQQYEKYFVCFYNWEKLGKKVTSFRVDKYKRGGIERRKAVSK